MKSMTAHEIVDWFNNVSYKPNVRIKARVNEFAFDRAVMTSVELIAVYSVPDSKRPHEQTKVSHMYRLDMNQRIDEEHLKWILVDWITNAETHEMFEWLMIDGKQIKDPHAEDFKP